MIFSKVDLKISCYIYNCFLNFKFTHDNLLVCTSEKFLNIEYENVEKQNVENQNVENQIVHSRNQ